jgi:hypothetical protein
MRKILCACTLTLALGFLFLAPKTWAQGTSTPEERVPLCAALLGEFNDPKYKYRHPITRQYMLASGAFLIENPDKAGDVAAMNLAAVSSTLKVYSAILQQKPDAKSKLLDDLLKKQSEGKLDAALRKPCR